MADKLRRDPKDRPLKSDKRISLYPLTTEEALRGLMQAGPHPKDDEQEPAEGTGEAPSKKRRTARRAKPSQATSG